MENTKKVPERQCVGCRAKRPKSELIRIVRPAESQTAELDRTGKKSGRGAYICPSADCLKKARKSGALQRAFGENVPDSVWETIETELGKSEK